jgi:hypothetical protein
LWVHALPQKRQATREICNSFLPSSLSSPAVTCNKKKHKHLFLFYFFLLRSIESFSLFVVLSFFRWRTALRSGRCGLWSAGFVYSVMLGLLDLEPGFVARAADRPHVWMAGSATSLLPLHFYTGVVVYCRHGWEIGAPSSFGFLLPTFSWLSFGWVLWRPGEQGG